MDGQREDIILDKNVNSRRMTPIYGLLNSLDETNVLLGLQLAATQSENVKLRTLCRKYFIKNKPVEMQELKIKLAGSTCGYRKCYSSL